jgi:hypothetical protein
MNKRIIVLLMLCFGISKLYAQQTNAVSEIRGFVYDKKTGEPIIFTNVFFEGTTIGVATDVNGFYSLTKIKPGVYKLVSTGIGYDKNDCEIST